MYDADATDGEAGSFAYAWLRWWCFTESLLEMVVSFDATVCCGFWSMPGGIKMAR